MAFCVASEDALASSEPAPKSRSEARSGSAPLPAPSRLPTSSAALPADYADAACVLTQGPAFEASSHDADLLLNGCEAEL